ncbi:MAG: DUF4293 family protein [Paludibacteraceae bacterium]|nr:DUF4293 family protein [Paludibacteraceae bacterium]
MSDMYKRWIFMLVAILASIVLLNIPVFRFQSDKGIISNRTYEMDQKNFYVWQTDFETNQKTLVGVVSVNKLYYCNLLIIGTSILCLLCFFSETWRIRLTLLTVFLCGAYYALMLYYAMRLSNEWFPTIYPRVSAILPAVTMEMMILTRKSMLREIRHSDERLDD